MDISTIAGITAMTLVIVGIIVTIAKITNGNVKMLISVGVACGLGVLAKVTGLGFGDLEWVGFILSIVAAILATKATYDGVGQLHKMGESLQK